MQLWGLRSPTICTCKLEAQESQWCDLVQLEGLRTPDVVNPSLRTGGDEMRCPSSNSEA